MKYLFNLFVIVNGKAPVQEKILDILEPIFPTIRQDFYHHDQNIKDSSHDKYGNHDGSDVQYTPDRIIQSLKKSFDKSPPTIPYNNTKKERCIKKIIQLVQDTFPSHKIKSHDDDLISEISEECYTQSIYNIEQIYYKQKEQKRRNKKNNDGSEYVWKKNYDYQNSNYYLPKYYSNVNLQQQSSYYDYMDFFHYNKNWGNEDDIVLGEKLGSGRFSKVFEAWFKDNYDERFVVKILKAQYFKFWKVRREILCLQALSGGPNIIELKSILRHPYPQGSQDDPLYENDAIDYMDDNNDSNTRVSFVFEYINNVRAYKEFYPTLSETDIRYYIRELLIALDHVHSRGIIHRDVKPYNTMIDHETKKLRLIDFGLSEFYFPNEKLETRVGSIHYKAPELLLNYPYYHYSIDSWAVGCILACFLFQKYPFFKGTDSGDQLSIVAQVVGSKGIRALVQKYNISIDDEMDQLIGSYPTIEWITFKNKENEKFITDDGLSLLDQLLEIDPEKRLLPIDALQHPYFKILDNHINYPVIPDRGLRNDNPVGRYYLMEQEKMLEERRNSHKLKFRESDLKSYKQIVPKRFADVVDSKSVDYWDYNNLNTFHKTPWGTEDDYIFRENLGRGKYSEVYRAKLKAPPEDQKHKRYVIKQLKNEFVRWHRLKREVHILKLIQGGPNIIEFHGLLRNEEKNTTSLVFEYIDNTHYPETWLQFSSMDICYYMRELLISLAYVHSKGIIHRDIKPLNVMIDYKKKKLRLIDFGLSEFYRKNNPLVTKVGTLHYKGPEMLLKYPYYTYAVDMWAIGCLFGSLLFQRFPLFEGSKDTEVLRSIIPILGTEDFKKFIKRYNIDISEADIDKNFGTVPRDYNWKFYVKNLKTPPPKEALDLLNKFLQYDFHERIDPLEALRHPYFRNILSYHNLINVDRGRSVTFDTFPLDILREMSPEQVMYQHNGHHEFEIQDWDNDVVPEIVTQ